MYRGRPLGVCVCVRVRACVEHTLLFFPALLPPFFFLFRLLNVQTSEELNDVYRQFLLYYGVDIEALQSARRGGGASQPEGKRWKHAYR